jgi:hypothetical protein
MATLQPGDRRYVYIDLSDDAATLPCEVAATPDGETFDPDTATWDTAEQDSDTTIRVLYGPGGPPAHELAAGTYHLRVRHTDAPQIPIDYSGILTIL